MLKRAVASRQGYTLFFGIRVQRSGRWSSGYQDTRPKAGSFEISARHPYRGCFFLIKVGTGVPLPGQAPVEVGFVYNKETAK